MQAFQSSAAAVYGRLYVLPSNNQTSPLISGDRRTAYSLSCDSPVPVLIDLAIKKVFLIMAALMK